VVSNACGCGGKETSLTSSSKVHSLSHGLALGGSKEGRNLQERDHIRRHKLRSVKIEATITMELVYGTPQHWEHGSLQIYRLHSELLSESRLM
jgi:hypothetical protein